MRFCKKSQRRTPQREPACTSSKYRERTWRLPGSSRTSRSESLHRFANFAREEDALLAKARIEHGWRRSAEIAHSFADWKSLTPTYASMAKKRDSLQTDELSRHVVQRTQRQVSGKVRAYRVQCSRLHRPGSKEQTRARAQLAQRPEMACTRQRTFEELGCQPH
jgi:hypothetical protein